MARVKHFIVLPEQGDYKRGVRGEAVVDWDPTCGDYHVEARTAHNVLTGTVYNNEAGFRGRQWEIHCEAVGDNLVGTLREAAQIILAKSWERSEGANRPWTPPSEDRVPILIHPDAKQALIDLLVYDERFQGVGYSQFIMQAVRDARKQAATA